jgi:hypothetical protein
MFELSSMRLMASKLFLDVQVGIVLTTRYQVHCVLVSSSSEGSYHAMLKESNLENSKDECQTHLIHFKTSIR